MTPFDAYREYVALKNHFTSKSYDYERYNGKIRTATPKSYEARRDKIFFMKLAKHKDPVNFLIANLVESDHTWIGDLAYNEQAQKNYLTWLKKTQSLSYVLKNDLAKLNENFDSNFKIESDSHPFILQLYLSKDITLESLVILTDLARCYSYWNKTMANDPVWDVIALKIRKYKTFLKYDRTKMKQIVLDCFTK